MENKEVKSINQIISEAIEEVAVNHKIMVSYIGVNYHHSGTGFDVDVSGKLIKENDND